MLTLYCSPECKSSEVTHLRIKGKFDSRFRENILKFLPNYIEKYVNVESTSIKYKSFSKPCNRLGESVWSMQNSSRQLFWQRFKIQPPECYQDFPIFGLVTYLFCLHDMIHIREWTRYYQHKHSDKVSSSWSKERGLQSINSIFLQFGLVT